MAAIGGYFSLELPLREEYHKDAIRLNTGRNCLEYILRARRYKKVYIPYYTCEVVLEPFHKLKIDYQFYHIDFNFEITDEIVLQKDEALLYTNYYGLKQRYVEKLAERYGQQLIVDSTQAFFAKPVEGVDTFYTCRKFFGVPDGAYLYSDKLLDMELEQDVSCGRMQHLLKRIDMGAEVGYVDFRKADDSLDNQPIKSMSKLTQRMMKSIDYDAVVQQRRSNYILLQEALDGNNYLNLPFEEDAVPMVYPYLRLAQDLRNELITNKVFVALYWPNVLDCTKKDDIENLLAYQMQPLPIDQRYGKKELLHIIQIICNIR